MMKFLPLALLLALLPASARSVTWRYDSEGLEVVLSDAMVACAITPSGFTVALAVGDCDGVGSTARVELTLRGAPALTGPALATAMCGPTAAIRSGLWIGMEPLYRCARPTPGAPERHFAFGARVDANNDPRSMIAVDLHCPPAQRPACLDLAHPIGRAASWFADPAGLRSGEPELRPDPAGNKLYLTSAHALLADLPAAWTVCVGRFTNHGFRVLMDPGDCEADAPGPLVAFLVGYNAADEYPSPPAMRRTICGTAPAHWSALRVAGARLMRCNLPSRDGLAELRYFGLRRRPGDTDRISTELGIRVLCPPRRMPACRAIARELAARMQPWNPD